MRGWSRPQASREQGDSQQDISRPPKAETWGSMMGTVRALGFKALGFKGLEFEGLGL